jgi:transcriptional regulator with XRE-family HTH domain
MEEIIFAMPDEKLRAAFGRRVKQLRKDRRWTQKDLADKLDVRFAQLNKYECGLHAPPVEKLIQLAQLFDTTVDYLLTGNVENERPLHNTRLLERFRALQDFDSDDLEAVIKLIDAMIVKRKVEGALKGVTKKAM